MKLSFLPLLQIQRDLYAMPRGMERFREYIKTMTDPETGDLALPLVAMNPMGKDHIPALIDEYIALGAEQIAQEAIDSATRDDLSRRASHRVPGRPGRVGRSQGRLDESLGQRIRASHRERRLHQARIHHRHSVDERARVRVERARSGLDGDLSRRIPAAASAREDRCGEMLEQEGYAMARAGCTTPALDEDDLAYTRSVIDPHLDAHDRATVIACLFGDTAANALGYPPQGLTDRAGLALALHEARLGRIRLWTVNTSEVFRMLPPVLRSVCSHIASLSHRCSRRSLAGRVVFDCVKANGRLNAIDDHRRHCEHQGRRGLQPTRSPAPAYTRDGSRSRSASPRNDASVYHRDGIAASALDALLLRRQTSCRRCWRTADQRHHWSARFRLRAAGTNIDVVEDVCTCTTCTGNSSPRMKSRRAWHNWSNGKDDGLGGAMQCR